MINCYASTRSYDLIACLRDYAKRIPDLVLINVDFGEILTPEMLMVTDSSSTLLILDILLLKQWSDSTNQKHFKKAHLIVLSEKAEDAMLAFELGALDFLLGDVSFSRFEQSVNRIRSLHESRVDTGCTKSFFVKGNRKGVLQKIVIDSILFIESALNYCYIHIDNGKKIIAYLALSEVENFLAGQSFIRIHKSFIVNTHKLDRIEGNEVTMQGTTKTIYVGLQYKQSFLASIRGQVLTNEGSDKKAKKLTA